MIIDSSRSTGRWARLVLTLMSALLLSNVARAADVSGLWATDASKCDKIFTRTGNGYALGKEADLYGSGFIIQGNRIITQLARCDIKTRKQDGPITHLIAACATDVMYSNMQASFKMIGEDRLLRIFQPVSDLEIPYERCVLK